MSVQQKLDELGLCLSPPPAPVGDYVPAVRAGAFAWTSGQLPTQNGQLVARGRVPKETSLQAAQAAARVACLNALGALAESVESLDAIRRIVRVSVYVASQPDFHDQAQVANGASELLGELFGEAGKHTRCAVGVAALPLNSPVEVDLVVELRGD